MLIGSFVVRGLGFSYPFLSYHLDGLGFSTSTTGWIVAAFGAGYLIGQIACGWLSDRIGQRATLVTAMAAAAVFLPALGELRSTTGVFVAAYLTGVIYDAARPVVSAVIADAIPTEAEQARVNGWRHFAINSGAALTGALGGYLAVRIGTGALFWINAAACAAFGFVALCFLPGRHVAVHPQAERTGYGEALRDGRLWLLSLASLCALICAGGVFTALPILMTADGLDAAAYGTTQVANGTAVVLLSPLLTPWLSHRAGAKSPMTGLLAASGLILGVAMGAAGLSDSTLSYSFAAALAVPGEILLFIAAGDLVTRIAPPQSRGLYAGLWGTNLAMAIMIAPVMTAWALDHGGDLTASAVFFGIGLVSAALCWPLHSSIHEVKTSPAIRESRPPRLSRRR
ncbi:MFS transporter [Streptomyces sp. NBC_00439]|uniref:MFS transporter n=1 Tax=Streptomyces sp. NBC_00439 TaxID=2903650 RepID=UPI00224D53C7|nr:MFS transporter [Streptomyces sp. NBC_00439]MCX5103492.1 MFS transporter [Streptomyces sp. NBC_00439]